MYDTTYLHADEFARVLNDGVGCFDINSGGGSAVQTACHCQQRLRCVQQETVVSESSSAGIAGVGKRIVRIHIVSDH